MSKNDLDAVEIAQKQRHLYLLGKVKNNQHLSQSELEELKKLEGKAKGRKVSKKNAQKGAIAASQVIKTQKEAAEYVGLSTRTIRNWIKDGMPRTGEGHYLKGMLKFYKENEGKKPTAAKTKGQTADAEYKDAKAKLMMMELQVKQGKLVPIEEYLKYEVKRHLAVRRGLLGLPRKLAGRVPENYRRKVQAIAAEEVRDILDAFAEGRPAGNA